MGHRAWAGRSDNFGADEEDALNWSGAGKSATFDQFDTMTYLHANVAADTSFDETMILRVNGFELNGSPVELPGFGTHYGMYFLIDATGHSPAGGPVSFDTMHIALMVDPGNNDGTTSSSEQGIGFSNGTDGDFALADGELIKATVTFDAAGNAHPNFFQAITPTPAGEKIFGDSLDWDAVLHEVLTTPGGPTVIGLGDGSTIQVVNGTGKTGLPATGVVTLDPQTPLSIRPGLLEHDGGGHGGLFCGGSS
jgi:hypothetical protein